jgi:hypothetical protein
MFSKTTIGIMTTLVLVRATDVSVDRNKTRTVIDPCRALCSANDDEGCAVSRTVSGQCQGLFRDQSGKIAHAEVPKPEWTSISADEARSILSTQTESCSDICAQLEDCPASYCKQNNHCHGLFWSDVDKREACFYTDEKPCRTKLPILCDYENRDSTTIAPMSTSLPEPPTAIAEADGVTAESSEETYLVQDETVVEDSAESEPNRAPDMPEVTETDSEDATTHIITPMSDIDIRSAQVNIPSTQPPLRANQNDTQAAKSFEVLRISTASAAFIFLYTML